MVKHKFEKDASPYFFFQIFWRKSFFCSQVVYLGLKQILDIPNTVHDAGWQKVSLNYYSFALFHKRKKNLNPKQLCDSFVR